MEGDGSDIIKGSLVQALETTIHNEPSNSNNMTSSVDNDDESSKSSRGSGPDSSEAVNPTDKMNPVSEDGDVLPPPRKRQVIGEQFMMKSVTDHFHRNYAIRRHRVLVVSRQLRRKYSKRSSRPLFVLL
jgi:hypothetical protein